MKPVNNETLTRQLNWRYAVKRFDPKRKIAAPDWKTLEEALVLSPSSYGLQPWRFFVVNDPGTREKLRAAAWNQSQITDASHLVVFAVRKDLSPADVDRFIARVAEVRNVETASLDGYKSMILGSVNRPAEQVRNWSARQVYIALGNFLTSAALLGIDACPMEGFDPAKVDQILGLSEKGWASVVIATAGYRSSEDAYAKLPKVRFNTEEVVEHV
jgi:nitroreductase